MSERKEARHAESLLVVGERWQSTGSGAVRTHRLGADAPSLPTPTGKADAAAGAPSRRNEPADAAKPTQRRPRRRGALNLWSYVQRVAGGCWPWIGYVNHDGYGRFGKTFTLAHRAVWEMVNGPIPPGAVIRHSCDNPLCCNPDHLLSGSHADNVADKCARNRQAKGESNGQAKLSAEAVLAIRREYVPRVVTQKDLARRHGVTESMVQKIVLGKYWKHLA